MYHDWTDTIMPILIVIILLFTGALIFLCLDTDTGQVVATQEVAGMITDMRQSSQVRKVGSVYQFTHNYYADVLAGNRIYEVHITEKEYYDYSTGMDIILLIHTVEGGITNNTYTDYSIKNPN